MKITPAAIRQQSFETSFRGYEKKEVSQFLEEVSQVVEKLHQENIELKSKLQNTEAEAKRLKDVEDSLFRTLKTAEDTGASIIEEANEAADLIISEANSQSEQTVASANEYAKKVEAHAQQQASVILGAAETKAKETIVELRESMQGLVRSYGGLVDQREALVKSLKRISQDMLNQIDLSDAHFSRIDAKAYQRAIDELSRSNAFTFANIENLVPEEEFVPENEQEDPMAEMEVIEEELELEIHDSTPDLKVEQEVKEEKEVEEEIVDEEKAVEEKETPKEDPEPVKEEKKVIIKSSVPEEEKPKSKEDKSNQSGSFFDQFD